MRIDEYISPEYLYRFGTKSSDTYKLSDTRRPRLTLRHLSKLRKMRQLKNIENQRRKLSLPTIYKDADDKSGNNKGEEAKLDVSKPALRSIKAKSKQKRMLGKAALRQI